jgi:antitoxin PrlF
MATSVITTKGQITIPAPVRSALGVGAGDRIEFVEIEKGSYVIVPATSPVSALRGILRAPRNPVSIEDMNAAIASEAAKAR